MKAHFEIKQGQDQWHEIRYGKASGTRAKQLFIKSESLFYDLLGEHTKEIEINYDSFVSQAMERGTMLEPDARSALSEAIGVELLECGWLQCEEIPLLGISPDGISECLTISAEIKCPENDTHCKNIDKGVFPPEHIHQCIHYFTINPLLKKHYFCSYNPDNTEKILFYISVDRVSSINFGTERNPKMMTITECVEINRNNAIELQSKLEKAKLKLSF